MRIETERLYIRLFEEQDALALLEYWRNPRVNCFKSKKMESLEDALAFIRNRQFAEIHLAVCLKTTNRLIGDVFASKDGKDTFGIGWHFNKDFEGLGYAFEAADAFIPYLFDYEGARRIYAYVEDDNLRSKKLCERLGMRYEGCFKEFISFINNLDGTPRYEDTCIYARLKKECKKNETR